MMRKLFLLILLITVSSITFSQSKEYYFKFKINDKTELNYLTKIISIDNVVGDEVFAYANPGEFAEFLKLGYMYTSLPHPGSLINPRMSHDPKQIVLDWDYYPTYGAYVAMMNSFASTYPNLCRIVNAGQTINGHSIFFAVISKNVNIHEAEPQFMYSSSIH